MTLDASNERHNWLPKPVLYFCSYLGVDAHPPLDVDVVFVRRVHHEHHQALPALEAKAHLNKQHEELVFINIFDTQMYKYKYKILNSQKAMRRMSRIFGKNWSL